MTTLLAEDKKVTRKRIHLQRPANNLGQRIEGLAKIGLTGREIDPSVGEKAQHLGRISRMDGNVEGPTGWGNNFRPVGGTRRGGRRAEHGNEGLTV